MPCSGPQEVRRVEVIPVILGEDVVDFVKRSLLPLIRTGVAAPVEVQLLELQAVQGGTKMP